MRHTSKTTVVSRLTLVPAGIWVLSVLSMPLAAQYRASLQGTVTDTQGSAVPDATVTVDQQGDYDR